jgi:hypothetical protein
MRLCKPHFHLGEDESLRPEQRIRHLLGPHALIGARGDCDQVLAVGADHDQRASGRHGGDLHEPGIDAVARETGERDLGEGIGADGAGQVDFRSGAARRQGLIGALAAGQQRVITADHGLAGDRQMRHRHDDVDIDRAEYQDHSAPSCRWR